MSTDRDHPNEAPMNAHPDDGTQLPPHLRPPTRSRAPLFIGLGVVAVLVVGVLAFGVFGVQTLFTDDTVDEGRPVFASGATDGPDGTDPAGTGDEPTGDPDEGSGTEVTVVSTGTFEGREHPGSGTVELVTDGDQTFVHFADDFETDNGPDLYAAVIVNGERVELDRLSGNRGSQNYELPADVDATAVESVQVWCKRFDVVFTEAAVA